MFHRALPIGCLEEGGLLKYVPISIFLFWSEMVWGKLFSLFVFTDLQLFPTVFFSSFGGNISSNIVIFPIFFAIGSVEVFFQEDLAGS